VISLRAHVATAQAIDRLALHDRHHPPVGRRTGTVERRGMAPDLPPRIVERFLGVLRIVGDCQRDSQQAPARGSFELTERPLVAVGDTQHQGIELRIKRIETVAVASRTRIHRRIPSGTRQPYEVAAAFGFTAQRFSTAVASSPRCHSRAAQNAYASVARTARGSNTWK
jgi:hypothetical protein